MGSGDCHLEKGETCMQPIPPALRGVVAREHKWSDLLATIWGLLPDGAKAYALFSHLYFPVIRM